MSEQEKRFCTGCGVAAVRQCVECGEWRCEEHITSMGWCYPGYILAGTERGKHCAGPRDHGEHRCLGMPHGARSHWHRPVRRVLAVDKRGEPIAAAVPAWVCASCLGVWARGGSRWREEPEVSAVVPPVPVPSPMPHCDMCGETGARPCPRCQCLRCEKHRDHRGYCKMDSAGVICAPENHPGELWAYPEDAPDRHLAAPAPLENDATRALRKRAVEGDSDARATMYRWMKAGKWCCVECWRDLRRDMDRRFNGETIYCLRCYEKHVAEQKTAERVIAPEAPSSDSPIIARYYYGRSIAEKPKPETTPAPALRFSVIYCSSAPPRELVQSTLVRCGSGLVGGEPVMAPMVWTWKMQREWGRHLEYITGDRSARYKFGYERRDAYVDRETVPPTDDDVYGGRVLYGVGSTLADGLTPGHRCRLCGGWLRTKEIVL